MQFRAMVWSFCVVAMVQIRHGACLHYTALPPLQQEGKVRLSIDAEGDIETRAPAENGGAAGSGTAAAEDSQSTASSSASTTAASSDIPRIKKMGLTAGAAVINGDMMKDFAPGSPYLHNNDGAKWFYNYNIVPSEDHLQYANNHKAEFVPMVGSRIVNMLNMGPHRFDCSSETWCPGYVIEPKLAPPDRPEDNFFTPGMGQWDHNKYLTPEEFQDVLEKVISKLTVRPKFIMGQNEPEDYHFAHKNMNGTEAAFLFAKFIQPAAKKFNLNTVSPTVNTPGFRKDAINGKWLAEFLDACWGMGNDEEYPCSIWQLNRVAVHFYTCMAPRWKEAYEYPDGEFYKNIKDLLKHINVDWDKYFSKRPLWITEFNCNNDNVRGSFCEHYSEGCSATLLGSHEEQCERITGQAANPWASHAGWGEGVIRWLENAPNVERWSWWTTFNPGSAPEVKPFRQVAASMVVEEGGEYQITPSARALMLGTDVSDCTYAKCKLWCFTSPDGWSGEKSVCRWKGCKECPKCGDK
jgi:hypothetical protein